MTRAPKVTKKVLRGIHSLVYSAVGSVISGQSELSELEGSVTRSDLSDARAALEWSKAYKRWLEEARPPGRRVRRRGEIMTDIEQAFLDAAVGLYLPALELLEHIYGTGDVPTPELRDALEKAIARFEAARSGVIDEAWANIGRQAGGGGS